MISTSIGSNIAQIRKSRNKTAEQMAEALGVSRQTISKWENGYVIPDACRMIDVATYLDVPVADIYAQMVTDIKSIDTLSEDEIKEKLTTGELQGIVNQFLDPKSVKQAILAYDNNPNKFSVKIGINIISYRDILLLASNMKHFMGYSETDNPVSFQEAKNENNVMQSLASLFKMKGLLVFYAGSYDFENEESIIGAEFNGSGHNPPEGTKLMVILRNEKELLEFKKDARELFTGLVSIKPERDWASPSGMKYLLCHHEFDLYGVDKTEYMLLKLKSLDDVLSPDERLFVDDCQKKLDQSFIDEFDEMIKCLSSVGDLDDKSRKIIEEWQQRLDTDKAEAAEECSPIQYIKDDSELKEIRRSLDSLDPETREAFTKACFGNIAKSSEIMLLDLRSKRFLSFWEDKASSEDNQ
ncbi:helix-turn-helix transcriptional regulator [Candidatus Saccharibacteria bacterium]|nr:helix-turn-helix transcriptional regulator [Candidatus Saccharibacteria bacterium]